jgi:hypothetical protein
LHIILAGQPQLASKLRHPSLTQLLQRITTVSRLERFSSTQMEECIAFRLRVAGFTGPALLSDPAMAMVKAASGGVPREINRICINAMQLGFALRQRPIGIEVIEEVMADLTLAKWIPEALPAAEYPAVEYPAVGLEVPKTPGNPVGFRAGAPNPPPASSPELHPVVVREGAAGGSNVGIPRNARLAAPESELRRVLLEAAVQRQRAAELRLLGLRHKESQASAGSQPLYPYKFAMGCVPCPSGAEPDALEGGNQPSASPVFRAVEAAAPGSAAQPQPQDSERPAWSGANTKITEPQ